MNRAAFQTHTGVEVPALTGDEMREVDRVAVEETGLSLVQMMEHAGRSLARRVLDRRSGDRVVVLAGGGSNDGGGLACARHLANRDIPVTVVLDRAPAEIGGATGRQLRILDSTDVDIEAELFDRDGNARLLVDSLIGYGLRDAPRGTTEELIRRIDDVKASVVSLDVPSGVNATTGRTTGRAVLPDETVTLALPKTGLNEVECEILLGDISIPAAVYDHLDIPYRPPFGDDFLVELEPLDRRSCR